jgi:hypothetical protein
MWGNLVIPMNLVILMAISETLNCLLLMFNALIL